MVGKTTTGYKLSDIFEWESDILECLLIISIPQCNNNWLKFKKSILNHHEYTHKSSNWGGQMGIKDTLYTLYTLNFASLKEPMSDDKRKEHQRKLTDQLNQEAKDRLSANKNGQTSKKFAKIHFIWLFAEFSQTV